MHLVQALLVVVFCVQLLSPAPIQSPRFLWNPFSIFRADRDGDFLNEPKANSSKVALIKAMESSDEVQISPENATAVDLEELLVVEIIEKFPDLSTSNELTETVTSTLGEVLENSTIPPVNYVILGFEDEGILLEGSSTSANISSDSSTETNSTVDVNPTEVPRSGLIPSGLFEIVASTPDLGAFLKSRLMSLVLSYNLTTTEMNRFLIFFKHLQIKSSSTSNSFNITTIIDFSFLNMSTEGSGVKSCFSDFSAENSVSEDAEAVKASVLEYISTVANKTVIEKGEISELLMLINSLGICDLSNVKLDLYLTKDDALKVTVIANFSHTISTKGLSTEFSYNSDDFEFVFEPTSTFVQALYNVTGNVSTVRTVLQFAALPSSILMPIAKNMKLKLHLAKDSLEASLNVHFLEMSSAELSRLVSIIDYYKSNHSKSLSELSLNLRTNNRLIKFPAALEQMLGFSELDATKDFQEYSLFL